MAEPSPSPTGVSPPLVRRPGSWIDALTVVAILAQGLLSGQFATTASVTHDEYWHLPVGVLSWKTRRFDWEPLNPPLARMWAALPVAPSVSDPAPPSPLPPGQYGDDFIKRHPQSFPALYVRGRLMMIAASLLTSLLIVGWSRREFGPGGACLTALAWCLSPSVIAHGSLVTTDMAAALGFVIVFRLLQRFARDPCWLNAIFFGLGLGLVQGLKYTCLLLVPMSLICWFLVDRKGSAARPGRTAIVARWGGALALSLIAVNAIDLFQGSFRRLDAYSFSSQALRGTQVRLATWGWLPCPLPAPLIEGIDQQRTVMEQGHPVYLNDVWHESGVPAYYVFALLDKTPLGALGLFALAVGSIYLTPKFNAWRRDAYWLLPAAVLVALASFQSMQLGLRYILPSMALGSVFVGRAAEWFARRRQRFAQLSILACAAGCLWALRIHPYELAYFNSLAGGPLGGRMKLADSNLDWGQDLHGLMLYVDEHSLGEIGLAYFGTVPPEALGLHYHVPPSKHPEPGVYAISSNFVIGRPHVIRDGRGGEQAVGLDEFFYFRFFEPVARIGWSIDVYRISTADVARWIHQMHAARDASSG